MVYIPPGEFLMGSAADDPDAYDWERPHEQPQHPVWLDGYYIDVHEVTNAEFERFQPTHVRNRQSSPCDDCPVDDVTWYEAQAYCAARTPPKGLPTEAEWEKGVREWTADWYGPDYYQQRVRENPKGPPSGERRVERGGAFFLPPRGVTPTIRYNHPPHFRLYFLGFRCAQSP
jgi:formylglycine-generating enzyme required for sulfatase activity